MKTQSDTATTAALGYTASKQIHLSEWGYPGKMGTFIVKVRLDDQCRNGHEDFAITADLYLGKRDIAGGCMHEEILEHFPELAPFVALHLADAEGCPMYTVENGFYHLQEGKAEHLQSHLRLSDEELAEIQAAPIRTKEEFSEYLETKGFRSRWKAEADAAIALLETLNGSGMTFESAAVKRNWAPLTPEALATIEERRASGYYEPEQVAARDQAKKDAEKAKRIKAIEDARDQTIAKATRNADVKLYLESLNVVQSNVIFYDHTNEITFNYEEEQWTSYCKKWTQEEFDAVVAAADLVPRPAGVSFVLKRTYSR